MKKRRMGLFLALLCLLLMFACAGPGKTSDKVGGDEADSPMAPGDKVGGDEADFPMAPNPLQVTVILNEGSTLKNQLGSYMQPKLQASDGTTMQYILMESFPLLQDAEQGVIFAGWDVVVNMTAVSAIEGLPFAQSFLAAVQLEPDDLLLLEDTSLQFEFPAEYDTAELVAFAANGTGGDFHLYPASFWLYDGITTAYLNIVHFGIYGVARITQSEVQAQSVYVPKDEQSQAEQVDAIHDWEQRSNDSYSESSDSDQFIPYIRAVFNSIPSVDQTQSTCAQTLDAAWKYLAWQDQVSWYGYTSDFQDLISATDAAMYEAMNGCLPAACEICKGPKDNSSSFRGQVQQQMAILEFISVFSMSLFPEDYPFRNQLRMLEYECLQEVDLGQFPEAVGDGGIGGDDTIETICEDILLAPLVP